MPSAAARRAKPVCVKSTRRSLLAPANPSLANSKPGRLRCPAPKPRATYTVFAYPSKTGKDYGKKGLSISLHNVQKMSDGEPFGTRIADATEDFGSVDEETWNDETSLFS